VGFGETDFACRKRFAPGDTEPSKYVSKFR